MYPMSKDVDSAFQDAGAKPYPPCCVSHFSSIKENMSQSSTCGLEIWCIENLRLIPVPRSSYGKFYSGSTYVILNSFLQKNGPPLQHEIHYWLGNDAKEEDLAVASDKALELDDALGSCAVQYREVQGQETEKFLSYFRPCIIPVEGVFSSEAFGDLKGDTYTISLFSCKGDHAIHVKEVPFSRSSLNHFDVFILDTSSKIFLFSGCNSSTQERAKALEVVQYIKENKHNGNCQVVTVDDGKFVGDADVGEFWSFFGGYAPIPRDSSSAFPEKDVGLSVKLFRITSQGKLCEVGTGLLNKELIDSDKCYMLDCGSEIFVWMGKSTTMTERRTSTSAIEDFLRKEGRSVGTRVSFLTEGSETSIFRSNFVDWPQKADVKLYEEGREKVAAIFKQRGYDVKELPDDEYEPVINCRGKLKVWRVTGDSLSLLPVPEQTKFFKGDCYIVQYTYSDNGRDETLLYSWFGSVSLMEDRVYAISHMNALAGSSRSIPVLAQIFDEKEPEQFFMILQTLIVFKGGMSSRYKKSVAEGELKDKTYDDGKSALFRLQGKGPKNMQAIQVDQVPGSLNSSYCYVLQTGNSIFTWIGNLSSSVDHDILDRMLELINPTWQSTSIREGSEPDAFWEALGGRSEYPKEKIMKKQTEDPHLFALVLTEGDCKVKEIYNYTQADLTTEDVLLLSCHDEVYVWIGCHSSITSKEQAFVLGQKFLDKDVLAEGLSLDTPVYVVSEGHEPPFFTRFFSWDPSKANMHGNSFERKLAILKGEAQHLEARMRNTWRTTRSRGSTPDSKERNGSPYLPKFSELSLRSPDNRRYSNPAPLVKKLFPESPPGNGRSDSPDKSKIFQAEADNIVQAASNLPKYSYERLKVASDDPVPDIDITKREAYLPDEEFVEKFGMAKADFYCLPKWKQNKLKISLYLF